MIRDLCVLIILVGAFALEMTGYVGTLFKTLAPSLVWALVALMLAGTFSLGAAWYFKPLFFEATPRSTVWALCIPILIGAFALVLAWSVDPLSVGLVGSVLMTVAVQVRLSAPVPIRAGRSARPRLRLWMMMGAVVLFAAVLDLAILAWRAFHACCEASVHEGSAMCYKQLQGFDVDLLQGFDVDLPRVRIRGIPPQVWSPAELDYFRAMERYHEQLSKKYYNAARHPWLFPSPDPKEPQKPAGSAL